MIKTRRW